MALLGHLPEGWPLLLGGAVLAGFVQGLSGFGFGLAASVVWAGSVSPQVAGPLIGTCSLAGQLLSVRAGVRSLDLRAALPMVAGGLAGVPLGIAVLQRIDPPLFQAGVGALLAVYCPAMLLSRQMPHFTGRRTWADAAAGFAGGVMGGIGGLSGPVPTLWCALRGWDRDTQRAVFQTFLIVAQVATLLGYLAAGAFTPGVVSLTAWVLPAMLAPSVLGTRAYGRFSPLAFRRCILALLFLSGMALLAQAGLVLLARMLRE